MPKKIIYFFLLLLFITSCSNTFDSVKRGVTGAKANSSDEFLVKKKDPLILPPDFEDLPAPDELNAGEEEDSIFEKNLSIATEDSTPTTSTAETSILKKIQSK